MRSGRVVQAGYQPPNHVKQRAATLNHQREIEARVGAAGANGNSEVMEVCKRRGKQRNMSRPRDLRTLSLPPTEFSFLFLRTGRKFSPELHISCVPLSLVTLRASAFVASVAVHR